MKIAEFRENLQGRPRVVEKRELDRGTNAYKVSNLVTKEEFEELQTDLANAIKVQTDLLLQMLGSLVNMEIHLSLGSGEELNKEEKE